MAGEGANPQTSTDQFGGTFTPNGTTATPSPKLDQFGGTFTPTATPAAPAAPEEGTFSKALRYMKAIGAGNPMAPSPDMAIGFAKTLAGYASHISNIVSDSYGNDLTDIPEYMREHPGASAAQAAKAITSRQWESKQVKNNRTKLREAGDWLNEQSKMPGWFEKGGMAQHIGGIGADIAAWESLGGVLGLSAPAGAALGEAGEAGMAAEPVEAQLKRAGDMITILKKNPVLEKAATVGLRIMHTMATNPEAMSRNAMISGVLGGIESEGDPEATMKSMALGGGIGSFAEAASNVAEAHLASKAAEERAVQQAGVSLPGVEGMSREDAIAALSKPLPPPIQKPIPERPVAEEATPTEVGPEPPSQRDYLRENAPEPPQRPTAPEALPPLPRPPKRTVLDEPELPPKPEEVEIPEPEPREPTPVGMEEPTAPDRFTMDFPSAEERLRKMQAETARSVTTDSGAVTAKHLENIQNIIQSREFARMPPVQRTQLLTQRTKLMNYLKEGRNPKDVLDEVNDFGQAAAYLRAAPDMAEKRWNTISSGEYESINKQLRALEGKPLDADAVLKQSELKDRLERMFSAENFKGVGSPGRRSLYRTMQQNAEVLQGVDDAISKSFSGAEKTGELNVGTLQTNWRNLVSKNTPEQMKAVLGEERYGAMNDFVNQVAAEPKMEAAGQAMQDAQFKEVFNNYKAAVKAAKTKDEMLAAADEAERNVKVQEQKDRIDQWKNDVTQAKDVQQAKQDEMDRTFEKEKAAHDKLREQRQKDQFQRQQEFAKAKRDFGNQQREYQQSINTLKEQHDAMVKDYKAQKADAKNQDKATQDRLDAEFKVKDDAWKAQKKTLDNTNKANLQIYRKAESARNKALTQLQKTPEQQLAESNQVKLANLLKVGKIGGLEYAAHFLPPGISTAVQVGVPAAVALGKVLAHPTTARLATQFLKWGGDVGAYREVISQTLRHNYEQER